MPLKVKDYRYTDHEVELARTVLSTTNGISALSLDSLLAERLTTSIGRARALRLGLDDKHYCTGENKNGRIQTIKNLREQGYTRNEIADELNITARQVSNYIRDLGLAGNYLNRHRPKSKPIPVNGTAKSLKPCLGWCGREIMTDNGHRYCPNCLAEFQRRSRETAPSRGRIVMAGKQCE